MRRRTGAHRCVVELTRLALGERDQLGDVIGRQRQIRDQDLRNQRGEADRHEIPFDVEGKLFVELRIDRVRGQREKDRIAVGRGLRRDIRADIAAGSAAVLDDDRLSEHRRERIDDDARDDIGAAGRRIGNDEADRLVGIILRVLRERRGGAQHCRDEPQRSTAGQSQGSILQNSDALCHGRSRAPPRSPRYAAVDLYLARCRVGNASASRRNGSPSSRVTIISSTVVLPSPCALAAARNAGPTSDSLSMR